MLSKPHTINRRCESCGVDLGTPDWARLLYVSPECPRCALWHDILHLPIVRHLRGAFGDDGLWVKVDRGPGGIYFRRRLHTGRVVR